MRNKNEIIKGVLKAVGITGIVLVAIVAPNLIGAFGPKLGGRKYSNSQLRRSLEALKRKKYIFVGQRGDKTIIELTEKGQKKLLEYEIDNLKIKPQKKWDRKWRVVIFDIPEKFMLARKVFMNKLRDLGFKMIQKSVWVCPYPCESEIEALKGVYEIIPFVKVIVAERIDFQSQLMKDFDLE